MIFFLTSFSTPELEKMVTQALQDKGHIVETFATADRALSAIYHGGFVDWVLVEEPYQTSESDGGIYFLKGLVDFHRKDKINTILFSGSLDASRKAEAYSLGVKKTLLSPDLYYYLRDQKFI